MVPTVLGASCRPAPICANDLVAPGAIDAAWDLGLAVSAGAGFRTMPGALTRPTG